MAKILIDTDTISCSVEKLNWLCTHGTVLSDDANVVCISKDQYERAKLLLKVTKELLEKQEKSHYVLNLLAETVFYDNTDCDGYCLKEDIEYWFDELEEQSQSDAIPKADEQRLKTDMVAVLDKIIAEIACNIIEDDTSGNTPARLRADWAAANKAHKIDLLILDKYRNCAIIHRK